MKKFIISLCTLLAISTYSNANLNFYAPIAKPKYWSEKYQTYLPNEEAEQRVDYALDPANDPIKEDQKRAREAEAQMDKQIRRNARINECYTIMRLANVYIKNDTMNDVSDQFFDDYTYCTKQPEIKRWIRPDGRYVKLD